MSERLRELEECRSDLLEARAEVARLTTDRDAEAENARLMQDRLTRVLEGRAADTALLRECYKWIAHGGPDNRLVARLAARAEGADA